MTKANGGGRAGASGRLRGRLLMIGLALGTILLAPIGPAVAAAGDVTEFSAGITAGSGPLGIAAGSDGNLWFTEVTQHRVGRITRPAP